MGWEKNYEQTTILWTDYMKPKIKKLNEITMIIHKKSKALSALINLIAFGLLLSTIGLIPYAIKSIYVPIIHNCIQQEIQVIDKSEYKTSIKTGRNRNRISIIYSTVTDGNVNLRVPTRVWNDCEYGHLINYYSYGTSNHYYKLKISNGILIFALFTISLIWIIFGLMGVGLNNKNEHKSINQKQKSLTLVIIDVIVTIIAIFSCVFFVVLSYSIMNQFIF